MDKILYRLTRLTLIVALIIFCSYKAYGQEDVSTLEKLEILQEDIKLCMKAETFKFLERSNTTENVQKWKEIIQEDIEKELNGEELDSEDDCGEEEFVEEFKKSECSCEFCKNINNIDAVWENWVPQTPIEKVLKKAIDEKL